MTRVYADWAATAPLCPEAAEAMAPYLAPDNILVNANANSLHSEGRRAFAAMEEARSELARLLGARPDELFFTSGATEADNAALFGMVRGVWETRLRAGETDFIPHLIVSSIEHDAILQPAHALEQQGVEVTYLDPDAQGFVSPTAVSEALKDNTVLISIMLANNEIGTIEPVAEYARIAHEAGVLIHTDAVQAWGKTPVDFHALGVDALSISAHKIGGPKGMGALCVKNHTTCLPYLLGGGQESGFRSGTQNVVGMVGFAAAARAVMGENHPAEVLRQRKLRDYLYKELTAYDFVHPSVVVDEQSESFLPNIVNVCVDELESETMILRFDREGIALSGGSACSSHSLEPSRVLRRIGISRDRALCSLRISIGRTTTQDDCDKILEAFSRVVNWRL